MLIRYVGLVFFMIYDLGTDINTNWTFNDKGDLNLVTDNDNIIQSITNRLNSRLGSMDAYYYNYGSELSLMLGQKINERLLDFIKIETETTIKQDPRLQDTLITVDYDGDGKIIIELNNIYTDDSDLSASLVLTSDGVVII